MTIEYYPIMKGINSDAVTAANIKCNKCKCLLGSLRDFTLDDVMAKLQEPIYCKKCSKGETQMKYVKNPIPVEAIQVKQGYKNSDEIIAFIGKENLCPIERRMDYVWHIKTSKGDMPIKCCDWILKGEDGKGGFHFWPVSDEYFKHNYEKLEE